MLGDIDFANEYEFFVEVSHSEFGVLGEGHLTFGGGGFVCVRFAYDWRLSFPVENPPALKAKSKDGNLFSLLNCVVEGISIFADVVVVGEVGGTIDCIQFKYVDVSEWFLHGQYVEGCVGEKVVWKNAVPQISVDIDSGGECFSLRTDTIGSLTKHGEDYVIHEHTRFIFERSRGFSVEEISGKSLELSTLLSLLTATPISIERVWVGGVNGYPRAAYFPAVKKIDRDSLGGNFWIGCLIQKCSLDEKWQLIFERYYASTYRETSWLRLAGMQRYEGFWEFKILGYVSLLDEYVSSYAKRAGKNSTKTPSEGVASFIEGLESLSSPLSKSQSEELNGLIDSCLLTSRGLVFKDKYKFVIEGADKDILRVVNLTDDDFSRIKKVRDKIAHGSAPDLSDITHQDLHVIVDKIALLLFYWAYLDLGLTASDFTAALKFTHNHLRRNPGLDEVYLDRLTKSAEFFTVTDELFDLFASGGAPILNVCFVQDSAGKLVYSEKYKAKLNAWLSDRSRASNLVVDAFGVEVDRVSSISTMYLECRGNTKRLHLAYIIRDA